MMDKIYYWVGAIMLWANFGVGVIVLFLWVISNLIEDNYEKLKDYREYKRDKKEFKQWQYKNRVKNWNK